MKEDFVSFEIAKKLKEKGFKETCLAYYTNDNTLYYNFSHKAGACCIDCLLSHNLMPKDSVSGKFVDAPTISQVLKLLREREIRIDIVVYPIDRSTAFIGGEIYTISIYIDRERDIEINRNGKYKYRTYEQAALAGIEYVLENLI